MSEKKFLDCKIEYNSEENLSLKEIQEILNNGAEDLGYNETFTIFPLPELASEEQLIDIIRKWEGSQSLVKINYESLVKALLGKVALPSPGPEKCILHPEGGCDCDKPPEKKEPEEKKLDNLPDSFFADPNDTSFNTQKQIIAIMNTIDKILSVIREMREGEAK